MIEESTRVPDHIVEAINNLNTAEEAQPVADSVTVFSAAPDEPLNEPDLITAHSLMDRRSYLKYALGKSARRLGLALAATGAVKATKEGSNYQQGVTSNQGKVDGGLVVGGAMLALKGDIMVRNVLKKDPQKS